MQTTSTRRGFGTADRRYIAQFYLTCSAADVAAHLCRPVGSIYQYVKRHPELQKRPRL
ncbi:hypothetical protein [Hymenobacter tenuis]